jgi:putative Mg2+ transporter-C (MgtC) family protein
VLQFAGVVGLEELRGQMHDALLLLGPLPGFMDRAIGSTPAATSGAVLTRLLVAAVLGGAIGVEREMKRRPAGLRTNMFMCFGSALFTMLSSLLASSGSDQTRIAAQIIAGIGFIGAGSIIHSRAGVQGVTTAATIFVVAAIGMCAGAGLIFPATLATVLVILGLLMLGILEQRVFMRPHCAFYQVEAATRDELYSLLEQAHTDKRSRILDLKFATQQAVEQLEFTLEAQMETHEKLRTRLRNEFDTHKIVLYSSSEQE